jgi:hypothetical protein
MSAALTHAVMVDPSAHHMSTFSGMWGSHSAHEHTQRCVCEHAPVSMIDDKTTRCLPDPRARNSRWSCTDSCETMLGADSDFGAMGILTVFRCTFTQSFGKRWMTLSVHTPSMI